MNILLTRFSSLGDVAMTLPVIRAFQAQFPEHALFFLSNKQFKDLFTIEENVTFISADLKKEHDGIQGLHQLYKSIKNKYAIDLVIDLHNSLRSNFINTLFKIQRVSVFRINKGRAEKKALTQKNNKQLQPLKHTTDRYADVFRKAGFDLILKNELKKYVYPNTGSAEQLPVKQGKWIGIAPFAKHQGKQLPLEKMQTLIQALDQLPDVSIFIFGHGEEEQRMTQQLMQGSNQTQSLINLYSMQDELHIMSSLDVMITMDSANMHLASAVGTPVVSIWGATHPFAGFLGFGQSDDHIVQDAIECRPCSVYGDKPCWRGDYACLHNISIQDVIEKVKAEVA